MLILRHARRFCQRLRSPASLNGQDLAGANPVPTRTVNYRESLGIFLGDHRTVGRRDHHSICSYFHALVSFSQPGVAGTRACRLATSADAASSFMLLWVCFYRMWPRVLEASVLAQPATVVKWHRRASDQLAVAITLSRTPQDERRNPGPDPSDEPRQSALERPSHPR
jgi:hypothetical protein